MPIPPWKFCQYYYKTKEDLILKNVFPNNLSYAVIGHMGHHGNIRPDWQILSPGRRPNERSFIL